MRTDISFHGVNKRGNKVDCSPLSGAKVRNAYISITIPTNVFIMWCLFK